MEDNLLDSQMLLEHVSFLENCFDNTFVLQNSLKVIKEYVTEELTSCSVKKTEVSTNIHNIFSQHKTAFEAGVCKSQSSQFLGQENTSKNLKNWGLPPEIALKYEQRGITEMFDWQVTCLSNSKVLLDCCNLVYSAPTSAGKTLVAEILTIKTILERQKKVIIILPFVSIVREKMFYLQDILSSSGIRVEGFMGSQSPPGGLQAVHVAICTIEKANSLVNRLLDDGNISELGAVIVDELHLLGDPHRGYILELLLTKIKYISSKSDDVLIQIVGMSATLPNLDVLATWLNAELFITQFRPIPLDEFCLVGNKYFNKNGECVNALNISKTLNESDSVLNICLETIKESCSVLIFCMTKNRCENLAQTISASFFKLGCQQCELGSVLRNELKPNSIAEVLEQLKNCPVGLDQVLSQTISFGVAYHHAGLTFDERDIIEGAFKSGVIRVLVATSTLSSGVNLPARKVVIRSPVFMRAPINILTYKQMIGRAGRMGKDTKGESILICTDNEKKIGFELMMGALDPVKSCIETADKYMRAVLEMIASQVVCTKAELDQYSKCTLLFTQQRLSPSQDKLLVNTLDELKNYELVRVQNDEEEVHYVATPLGKACLSASMAPTDGLSLFIELQKARQCLVLETDLHLIYLVTPYSVSSQWGDIDWLHLLTMWESLTKAMKRVGELVGVQESFIIRCLRGTKKLNDVQNKLNIHKRFYTALALQDLVNEVALSDVAAKFQCARGFLQSLQQSAATFAGMVTAFCRQLGWKNMEILISQFQDRLHFGIHSELLELMKLPSLNGVRARTLFDAGFETVSSVASADVNIIENVLHKATPFQSEKERDGDDSHDLKKRIKIKSIWITGCCGMTAKEAAQNLIVEARKYLENEIGVTEIKWNSNATVKENNTAVSDSNAVNDNCNTEKQMSCGRNEAENDSESILKVYKTNIECTTKTNETVEQSKQKSRISLDVLDMSAEESYNTAKSFNTIPKQYNISHEKGIDSPVCDNFLSDVNSEQIDNNSTPTIASIESGSKAPDKSNNQIENNYSKEVKDEIVWDSLNFTDAVIGNITKLRDPEKTFSPNISFGENDKSIEVDKMNDTGVSLKPCSESNSARDISIFSVDGDTSSIFEESLPLDLIPSRLLDTKIIPKTVSNPETTADFVNINSNSILNVFESPLLEPDEGEDMKLFLEEDDENQDPDMISNTSRDNEVMCSQDNIKSINEFTSPFNKRRCNDDLANREQKAKKKKLNNYGDKKIENNHPLHKKTTIEIDNYCLECILIQENGNTEELQKPFYPVASISLKCKPKSLSNNIIGSDILKITKDKTIEKHITGMCLYIGKGTCIYLNETALVNSQEVLKTLLENKLKLNMFCLKTNYISLKKAFGIELPSQSTDLCTSEWLLMSDKPMRSYVELMKEYCKLDLTKTVIKVNGNMKKFSNLELYVDLCLQAWCYSKIAEAQSKIHVNRAILDIEHHIAIILAENEYHGITVDKELASQMLNDVKRAQDVLQKKANKLAGCQVNFNSSKCVAKALGLHNRGKVSTKKSVLTCHNSPLSSVVIYWRKLNCILTKTLYLITEKAHFETSDSEGNRIKPSYVTQTCTGRISMHTPNLQNVPRTFSIPNEYLDISGLKDTTEFNCRNIFRAGDGHVIVSADYCQLEMRILTHLSEDAVLLGIMRSDVDVFKSIAASWSGLNEDEVDDDLRQKTKQLCYGIIYGMGLRTLSQHLDVVETEAAFFMDSFYKTFPRVKRYTESIVEVCRKRVFVETIMKRRRHLPDINHHVASIRGAAERQAVNTTIQGSAADIAKSAMCTVAQRTKSYAHKPRLLLQMHDELIYEVVEENKLDFCSLLKECMEGTVKLKVPLPVKVKSGYTWGTLKEIEL